jgi:hypothetical protein
VRCSSNPIGMLGTMLGVVGVVISLAISGITQISGQNPGARSQGETKTAPPAQNVPPCASTSSSSSADHAPSQVNPSAHSVTLSWKASVPRSSSQQDAVQGYNVYRSLTSNKYDDSNKINSKPLPGTQCVDTAVEPRGTYFYVVRAVARSGVRSYPSNQATVLIPFP